MSGVEGFVEKSNSPTGLFVDVDAADNTRTQPASTPPEPWKLEATGN
jgi:hypothetical protein